jgi:hypothetical protein
MLRITCYEAMEACWRDPCARAGGPSRAIWSDRIRLQLHGGMARAIAVGLFAPSRRSNPAAGADTMTLTPTSAHAQM